MWRKIKSLSVSLSLQQSTDNKVLYKQFLKSAAMEEAVQQTERHRTQAGHFLFMCLLDDFCQNHSHFAMEYLVIFLFFNK